MQWRRVTLYCKGKAYLKTHEPAIGCMMKNIIISQRQRRNGYYRSSGPIKATDVYNITKQFIGARKSCPENWIHHGFEVRQVWISIHGQSNFIPLIIYLSVFKRGQYLCIALWGLNEIIYVKCLAQCLEYCAMIIITVIIS